MLASLRSKVMASAPVVVLSTLTAGAGYAIYYAHHQQVVDKKNMRSGVVRDIKRDRKKRQEEELQRLQTRQQQQQQQL